MKEILFLLVNIIILASCNNIQKSVNSNNNFTNFHNMVFVEGGTFSMGCTSKKKICDDDEVPIHKVKVFSFSIDKYEVTNEQYVAFLNEIKPLVIGVDIGTEMSSIFDLGYTELDRGSKVIDLKCGNCKGKECHLCEDHNNRIEYSNKEFKVALGFEKHPVVLVVNWYGANAYAKHYGLRLPTEAEWEYAARGGLKSSDKMFAGGDDITTVGWAQLPAKPKITTQQVGQLQANELGIYDMSGNVYEWCSDIYQADYYKNSPADNPKGPDTPPRIGSEFKVRRGGAWVTYSGICRVADRSRDIPFYRNHHTGFRCVKDN